MEVPVETIVEIDASTICAVSRSPPTPADQMVMIVEGYWLVSNPGEVHGFLEKFCGTGALWKIPKNELDLTPGAKVIKNLKTDVMKIGTELKSAFKRQNDDINHGLRVTTRHITKMNLQPDMMPIRDRLVVDLRTGLTTQRNPEHNFIFECPVKVDRDMTKRGLVKKFI
jgi:hypothetical protein